MPPNPSFPRQMMYRPVPSPIKPCQTSSRRAAGEAPVSWTSKSELNDMTVNEYRCLECHALSLCLPTLLCLLLFTSHEFIFHYYTLTHLHSLIDLSIPRCRNSNIVNRYQMAHLEKSSSGRGSCMQQQWQQHRWRLLQINSNYFDDRRHSFVSWSKDSNAEKAIHYWWH